MTRKIPCSAQAYKTALGLLFRGGLGKYTYTTLNNKPRSLRLVTEEYSKVHYDNDRDT